MLIILHLTLMIAVTLTLITGVVMAIRRQKKNWLKLHRTLNTTGVACLPAGAAAAFASIVLSEEHHLAGPHQWTGLTVIVLCAVTLYLGYFTFKAKNKPRVRAIHRSAGRLSLAGLLAAVTLGLKLIGLF